MILEVPRSATPALPCLGLLLGSNGGGGLAPPGGSARRGTERPGGEGEGEGGGGAGLPKLPPPPPPPLPPEPDGGGRSIPEPPAARPADLAAEPLVQPRGHPSGPRPAAPACHPRPQFPHGPRAGEQALSAVAPARGPSIAASSAPLTKEEDSIPEGHCAAGGGDRGPRPIPPRPGGKAPPGPARLGWKPGRQPVLACPRDGELALLLRATSKTRFCLPGRGRASPPLLLPTATVARGADPRRVPAVSAGKSLLFLSLPVPICEMGHQGASTFRRLVAKPRTSSYTAAWPPHLQRSTLIPFSRWSRAPRAALLSALQTLGTQRRLQSSQLRGGLFAKVT